MSNNGFFVFSGLMESLKSLKTNSKKWKTFEAIFNYAVSGVCPEGDMESSGIFLLCKAMIDGKSAKTNKESCGEDISVGNNQGSEPKSSKGNKKLPKNTKKPAKLSKNATISSKNQEKTEIQDVYSGEVDNQNNSDDFNSNEKLFAGCDKGDNRELVKVDKMAKAKSNFCDKNGTKMVQNEIKMKKNESILNQNELKMEPKCDLKVEFIEVANLKENKGIDVGLDDSEIELKNNNLYYNKKNNKNKKINNLSSSLGETKISEPINNGQIEEDENKIVVRGVRSLKNKLKNTLCPPELSEIEDFCEKSGLKVNSNAFFCYYSAKNWKINGKPIIDWRAVLLRWNEKLVSCEPTKNKVFGFENHEQNSLDFNEMYSSLDDGLF